MNTVNFGKLHCSLSKIMNNKQVLVYGVLGSRNDLRSIFIGHTHFKKLLRIYWNISLLHDQAQEQEIRFLLITFIDKNHFTLGQRNFKETFWIPQFQWNILLRHDQNQEHESGCFYAMSAHKNYLTSFMTEAVII